MPADGTKTSAIWTPQSRGRRFGRKVAAVSGSQYGVITLDQLRGIGLSASAVRSRVEEGYLIRVHEGVYAVGSAPLTEEGRLMAAVLACGEGSVVSHGSAAHLWGLREEAPPDIDVIACNRRGRSPNGIKAHRNGTLRLEDRVCVRGIPCTTVARTLLDIAASEPVWNLRRAVAEAEVRRILDLSAAREAIDRSRGRRGVARFRALLNELHPATTRTRSELERRFLAMCRRGGLPAPEVNVTLATGRSRLEVDFVWRDARLVVETDGHRYHDTASARERDRIREHQLQLAGWRVSRCTWAQVVHRPRDLVATLRGLLSQPLTDGTETSK